MADAGAGRRVCRYWASGACRQGEACRFAHVQVSQPLAACRNWASGAGCRFGEACRFAHTDVQGVPRPPWQQPDAHGAPLGAASDAASDAAMSTLTQRLTAATVEPAHEGRASGASDVPNMFAPGTIVLLHGLKSAAEWNGTHGQVMAYDAITERYTVRLKKEGRTLALKPDNLQQIVKGVDEQGLGKDAHGTTATGTTSAEQGMRATHEGSLAHRGRRTHRPQREQQIPYISPEALHAALANGAQYISSEALLAELDQAEHRARRAPISREHLIAAQLFIEQKVLLPAWQNATDLVSACLYVSAGNHTMDDPQYSEFSVSVQRAASGSCRWNPYLRCNRNACGVCNLISPSDQLFKSMCKNSMHIFQVKSHHRGDDVTRISSFIVITERPGFWQDPRRLTGDQVRLARNTNRATGQQDPPEEGVIYH
jgi:hypothetical protein